jgi:hypothetical protein
MRRPRIDVRGRDAGDRSLVSEGRSFVPATKFREGIGRTCVSPSDGLAPTRSRCTEALHESQGVDEAAIGKASDRDRHGVDRGAATPVTPRVGVRPVPDIRRIFNVRRPMLPKMQDLHPKTRTARHPRRARPSLEALEGRQLLTDGVLLQAGLTYSWDAIKQTETAAELTRLDDPDPALQIAQNFGQGQDAVDSQEEQQAGPAETSVVGPGWSQMLDDIQQARPLIQQAARLEQQERPLPAEQRRPLEAQAQQLIAQAEQLIGQAEQDWYNAQNDVLNSEQGQPAPAPQSPPVTVPTIPQSPSNPQPVPSNPTPTPSQTPPKLGPPVEPPQPTRGKPYKPEIPIVKPNVPEKPKNTPGTIKNYPIAGQPWTPEIQERGTPKTIRVTGVNYGEPGKETIFYPKVPIVSSGRDLVTITLPTYTYQNPGTYLLKLGINGHIFSIEVPVGGPK